MGAIAAALTAGSDTAGDATAYATTHACKGQLLSFDLVLMFIGLLFAFVFRRRAPWPWSLYDCLCLRPPRGRSRCFGNDLA